MKFALASIVLLVGTNSFAQSAGPGVVCADAARAAARQHVISLFKYEGVAGLKVSVVQANFSAEYVKTNDEGKQGTFTDTILVNFLTKEAGTGSAQVTVEGQLVGDKCNILRVLPEN